ncbi:ATP-binding protein [Pseudomonas fragi]|uniref:ATP-binding protein n=1 Tax=Pseudomonas fragi TaxID=296 RepID=UPI001595A4F5|nr:ATP-binding protein [Pseudomonas fragi]
MQSTSLNDIIYQKSGAAEIDDNPLIAHLNLPPDNDRQAFIRLGLKPEYDTLDRELPTYLRRIKINRLRHFFAPTHPVHRRALIGISSQLFDGYIPRNPMSAEGQRALYGGKADITIRPTISLIAGHSGMGKSTLLDRVLESAGQQSYQHALFQDQPFPERQILWLRRNVPEHCTVKTLCASFGDYTDRILGLKLYHGIFQDVRGGDRNFYLSEIRKIITTHHVGLLVLDEFQNLSLMGVGAAKVIAFLVNLRDELGIPIVIAGTYKALRLLEGDLSISRRLVEGGYYDLKRPLSADDESFNQLCKIAWKYQWTKERSEISDRIIDALYDVSQGITGIMLSVFASAQLAAIEDGSEKINENTIIETYNFRMTPLHPAVNILKSNSPRLIDKFDEALSNALSPNTGLPESQLLTQQNTLNPIRERQPSSRVEKANSKSEPLSKEEIKQMVLNENPDDLSKILERP